MTLYIHSQPSAVEWSLYDARLNWWQKTFIYWEINLSIDAARFVAKSMYGVVLKFHRRFGNAVFMTPSRYRSDRTTLNSNVTASNFHEICGPVYQHGITSLTAWISNHMPNKVWDEITYPFPNFNGSNVEVWEFISNIMPHVIKYVITHTCWD